MIKKLMQFRNTIVALLGIEFILALLTFVNTFYNFFLNIIIFKCISLIKIIDNIYLF